MFLEKLFGFGITLNPSIDAYRSDNSLNKIKTSIQSVFSGKESSTVKSLDSIEDVYNLFNPLGLSYEFSESYIFRKKMDLLCLSSKSDYHVMTSTINPEVLSLFESSKLAVTPSLIECFRVYFERILSNNFNSQDFIIPGFLNPRVKFPVSYGLSLESLNHCFLFNSDSDQLFKKSLDSLLTQSALDSYRAHDYCCLESAERWDYVSCLDGIELILNSGINPLISISKPIICAGKHLEGFIQNHVVTHH